MVVLKLTGWYKGTQKPKRVGVYQRDYGTKRLEGDLVYSFWNGKEWMCFGNTPNEAAARRFPSVDQTSEWRGLAEKP